MLLLYNIGSYHREIARYMGRFDKIHNIFHAFAGLSAEQGILVTLAEITPVL